MIVYHRRPTGRTPDADPHATVENARWWRVRRAALRRTPTQTAT
jgi:hypothetical protein